MRKQKDGFRVVSCKIKMFIFFQHHPVKLKHTAKVLSTVVYFLAKADTILFC